MRARAGDEGKAGGMGHGRKQGTRGGDRIGKKEKRGRGRKEKGEGGQEGNKGNSNNNR